ncbi:HlyD family efflux transporter periplasmic adaptor subunit [Aestuariibacter sp. AA17]|uniref:HlyD family efflux transporter periplasmic adaptor subunit n=1 Tax=Fluctibacter corallii TaxID=2984329 RepID=A0ABT3A799_9ALTE|nr:HlyD family efflux transporter periplasmic adaptor subunit [Aestuariibacter sp. AA17]MCV2884562.1 HlyD family efflux transporter periplasmic adaptor subunit [Aestuariibacter sp. AA17]
MRSTLFRENAVQAQTSRIHGNVLVLPNIRFVFISVFLFCICAVIAIWLCSSTYERKESVSGWLEPTSGIVKIYTDTANGKIKSILVKKGEFVEQGQPLLVINGDRFMGDGTSLEETLLLEYQSQHTLLKEELARVSESFTHSDASLRRKLTHERSNLSLISDQQRVLEERESMLQERLHNYQNMLQSGHMSKHQHNDLHQQLLILKSDSKRLAREKLATQEQISTLRSDANQLPLHAAKEKGNIQREISNLALKIQQIHGQRAQTIRASKAGYIENINVVEGQQTPSNTPLLSIVPSDAALLAKFYVPVHAIGFIEANQTLSIRYDAFPYQKFGTYQGQITLVANAITLPNEVHNRHNPITAPAYLVEAELASPYVSAYGKTLPLKSGMTLTADVSLSERSLLEWLLEPLYSLRGRV